jgi:hypothetical protein
VRPAGVYRVPFPRKRESRGIAQGVGKIWMPAFAGMTRSDSNETAPAYAPSGSRTARIAASITRLAAKT